MRVWLALVSTLTAALPAAAVQSVYDVVLAGKTCVQDQNQQLSCSYKVGKTLFFEIAGIGSPDGGVAFLKSDIQGDYYASFGLQHGCVIVRSGPKNPKHNPFVGVAFVSPKNGKVYETWQECQVGH